MQKKKQPPDPAKSLNGQLRMIPLGDIEPAPNNTRKSADGKKFAELVKSVKQNGVLQPILVRASDANHNPPFQIIAGERRFRAACAAELTEIPAYIKALCDVEALGAQIVENLQREDVHPLDEADGLLRLREEMQLNVRQIAARVSKDPRHVARRLALTNLIEEACEDFRKERLTLAHVLEICRYAPEIQTQALVACYETKSVRSQKNEGYDLVPDKAQPARPVHYLQQWLTQNVQLNLQLAPFKLDDARLHDDGLTCLNCPQRTGANKLLFADVRNGDCCLNPICFQRKFRRLLDLTKADVETKQGKPAVFISAYHGWSANGAGTLSRDQYQLLEKKADRCEYAEQAVYDDGAEVGKVKWICRKPDCKDHLGRVRKNITLASNGTGSTGAGTVASADNHHVRKQELFDIKVDELVRKRIFAEALKTFAWPLERQHLNEAIKEFFCRLPTDVQKTIGEVLGWDKELAAKVRLSDETALQQLAKLDYHQLAQFLVLCSFAHYGANQDGSHRVDQSAVVTLSQSCGVNHTLIDAQVRAELSPKKYKAAHQSYLAVVKNGRTAEKPVVYERIAQTA